MSDAYTEDLSRFGARERKMLAEILVLPLPKNFSDDKIRPAMNMDSGYVFLVNADYQVAMLNPKTGQLEIFHSTPYDGHEGFIVDLMETYKPDDLNYEDVEYIRDAAQELKCTLSQELRDLWAI